MARNHARIYAAIWKDPKFVALPSSAQRVYMLALSQPGVSFCGVVSYTGRRWASMAPDTDAAAIEEAVTVLEAAEFVVVDRDTEELLIRSFVKHDGVADSPNLIKAMWKDFDGIFSPLIRDVLLWNLPDECWTDDAKGIEKPSCNPLVKGSPKGYPTPVPTPTPVPSPTPSAPAKRARARDPIWDGLIEAWRIDESELTENERKRINTAAGRLRAINANPEEIPARRAMYSVLFPNAAQTMIALVDRWAECRPDPGRLPQRGSENVAPITRAIARRA